MALFDHLGRLYIRAASARRPALFIPSLRMATLPVLPLVSSPNFHGIRGKKTQRELALGLSRSEEGSQTGSRGKKARFNMPPMEEDASWWPTFVEQAEEKMKSAVDHFVKELGTLETRASGRVNPSLLDPIRVPSADGGRKLKLSEVATVGVKEGQTLVITLFDDKMLRIVEKTLLDHRNPGVIPQVVNETTIRIPMAKPTLESRQAFIKEMSKLAELSRIQVRAAREAVLKAARGTQKTPVDKNSPEAKKLQVVTDRYITSIDDSLRKTQSSLQKL